jgi:ABC-type multidrug transport system permease subunit
MWFFLLLWSSAIAVILSSVCALGKYYDISVPEKRYDVSRHFSIAAIVITAFLMFYFITYMWFDAALPFIILATIWLAICIILFCLMAAYRVVMFRRQDIYDVMQTSALYGYNQQQHLDQQYPANVYVTPEEQLSRQAETYYVPHM